MSRAVIAVVLAACGGSSVDIPEVPAGEFEADCQRLCTVAAGDDMCTAKHAEYCIASCRARTNGLTPSCGACMVAAGTPLHGEVDVFGDPSCVVGGPASVQRCSTECDPGPTDAPAPELATLCDLECGFYMSGTSALACSADNSEDCLTACNTAVSTSGRLCAQCEAEQTGASRTCINDDCDCENYYPDSSFGCSELCDAM